jgi:tRNA(adenine34) deaminase
MLDGTRHGVGRRRHALVIKEQRKGLPMSISESDILFFERTISLAGEAEKQGNLPIGAVICYGGKIIAEGKNAIWHPTFNPNRHAEIEALRSVPEHFWEHSREMTLYTTLEPCLMCMGAILLHQIGRVVFGSSDDFGGASTVIGHMPPYFENELSRIEWIGPVHADRCDPLYERVIELEKRRGLGS